MCGIAGIVRLDGEDIDPVALDRLTDALTHRGPDGRGTFIAGSVGLGHRRLKILDLSDAALQPMSSDDANFVLVFNGEIFNFRALREMLQSRGHRFSSTGDTEVLLKLYEEEGESCVMMLRGQFAFAVFDRKRNTVFLALDRIGKKPLKYFHANGIFAFASELKALRRLSSCPQGIDDEAIHHYLTMMYAPSPSTGFCGIRTLSPGSCITIDLTSHTVHNETKYWQLSYEPKQNFSLEEWKRRFAPLSKRVLRSE